MKHLLALALITALSAGCSAEPSRVDVAYTLYKDCVAVTIPAGTPYPTSKFGIRKLVESVDQYCISWTSIWLFSSAEEQPDFSALEQTRFNNLRLRVINNMIETVVFANNQPKEK